MEDYLLKGVISIRKDCIETSLYFYPKESLYNGFIRISFIGIGKDEKESFNNLKINIISFRNQEIIQDKRNSYKLNQLKISEKISKDIIENRFKFPEFTKIYPEDFSVM